MSEFEQVILKPKGITFRVSDEVYEMYKLWDKSSKFLDSVMWKHLREEVLRLDKEISGE